MGREEQPHVSALFECARSPEISQRFPLRNSFSPQITRARHISATSRPHLGHISAAPRQPLGSPSATLRQHLGRILAACLRHLGHNPARSWPRVSATPRPLGRTSAASRPNLGQISAKSRPRPSHCPDAPPASPRLGDISAAPCLSALTAPSQIARASPLHTHCSVADRESSVSALTAQ